MEVEIIDADDGFGRIRGHWDRVHALDPEADYFLSSRWLAEVLRANPGRWQILAVRDGEHGADYVGFLPLMRSVRWSQSRGQLETELEAAGRLSWAQYEGFLCDPEREETVIRTLAEAVRNAPWGYFSQRNCSASPRRLELFLQAFPAEDYELTWGKSLLNDGAVDNLVCPFAELPGDYETWLQTALSSNTRQKIRRFGRRLEESPDQRIAISRPEEFAGHLQLLLELWRRKWEPVRGAEDARATVEKYTRILSQSHACDAMFLPALWQGDRLVGALAIIVDRDKKRMYFIAAGRDEESSDPAIGLLLHAFSIRWAIENGIKVYDFCHGNEAYKYSLGATDRKLVRFELRRRSHVPTGRFDPVCLGQALDRVVRCLQTDRTSEALATCQYLRQLCR